MGIHEVNSDCNENHNAFFLEPLNHSVFSNVYHTYSNVPPGTLQFIVAKMTVLGPNMILK